MCAIMALMLNYSATYHYLDASDMPLSWAGLSKKAPYKHSKKYSNKHS
jgi:hypothetical protein